MLLNLNVVQMCFPLFQALHTMTMWGPSPIQILMPSSSVLTSAALKHSTVCWKRFVALSWLIYSGRDYWAFVKISRLFSFLNSKHSFTLIYSVLLTLCDWSKKTSKDPCFVALLVLIPSRISVFRSAQRKKTNIFLLQAWKISLENILSLEILCWP